MQYVRFCVCEMEETTKIDQSNKLKVKNYLNKLNEKTKDAIFTNKYVQITFWCPS